MNFEGMYIKLEFRCKDETYMTDSYNLNVKWISKKQQLELHSMINTLIEEYLSVDRTFDLQVSQKNRDRL